jgi:hypothetical protein
MSLEDFMRLQDIKIELRSQIDDQKTNQHKVNQLLLEAIDIISYELIDLENNG